MLTVAKQQPSWLVVATASQKARTASMLPIGTGCSYRMFSIMTQLASHHISTRTLLLENTLFASSISCSRRSKLVLCAFWLGVSMRNGSAYALTCTCSDLLLAFGMCTQNVPESTQYVQAETFCRQACLQPLFTKFGKQAMH